jgi:uroporphyrinogen III methyltransferase/synthase
LGEKMQKPLAGKRILITRASSQIRDLSQRLEDQGADVVEVPTIRIVLQNDKIFELEEALDRIKEYNWLILTSANTVSILNEILMRRGETWSLFSHLQIACIGRTTADQVTEHGGRVSLIPPHFQAESLSDEILKFDLAGKRILMPRAAGSRDVLPQSLAAGGSIVHEIPIYRADLPETNRTKLMRILRRERIDYITFTSSSTVRNFVELAGEALSDLQPNTKIACIGPITARTATEYGLIPAIVAQEFTISGLVQALIAADRPSLRRPS